MRRRSRRSTARARRHNDPVLAALGHFCFHHRRLVLVGWLVAFLVGLGLGVPGLPAAEHRLLRDEDRVVPGLRHHEQLRAVRLAHLRRRRRLAGSTHDARRTSTDSRRRPPPTPGVARVIDPATAPPEAGLVAADGKAVLYPRRPQGPRADGENRALDSVETTPPHPRPGHAVARSSSAATSCCSARAPSQSQKDTERGEAVALPDHAAGDGVPVRRIRRRGHPAARRLLLHRRWPRRAVRLLRSCPSTRACRP